MKNRIALYKAIEKVTEVNFLNRKWLPDICEKIYQKYDIPPGITSDTLMRRTDIEDTPDAILLCIAKESKLPLDLYFTDSEIEEYSNFKYEASSVSFPYVFDNMIEISEGKQYIGKITVKQLMKLRDSQILNYNANTQRQMQLKTGNNFSYFRIALNRKAVNQISDLLISGDFIPNTITLNINPETDFIYSNGKLKINEEAKFDILDGYHRYIALSNMYNLNQKFDYTMELRVTFFREEIARQFIFQEDQKTKLAKIDSEAMDKNSVSNKICKELFDLIKDKLNVTDIIRQGVMSKMIQILYIETGKSYNFKEINIITNQIFKAIKDVALDVPELLDQPWSDIFTVMFMTLAKSNKLSGKDLYDKATEMSKTTKLNISALSIAKINRVLTEKGGNEYVV